MKRMKNFSYVLFCAMIALVFTATSCKNDNEPQLAQEVDVSFNLSSVSVSGASSVVSKSGMLKAKEADGVSAQADYVKYKVDGGDFKTIPVFYISGIAWTNPIKLTTGTHTLSEFLVYSDNQTPNDATDDVLLSAVPHTGSTYAGFVTSPLDQTFTISTDKKNEINLQVVTYTAKTFSNFGFVYYKLSEINVKQLFFFADFCIKNKADYNGSQYANQSDWSSKVGPFVDAPAIMKIEVWRNGVLQNTFSNSAQGEKLSVNYADYAGITDNYELKLFILVKQGTAFNYVYFKSWTFADNSNIAEGSDGVIDGVLGNCYDPSDAPDFILAPWTNLPSTLTYKITSTTSTLGGYVDALLSNIGAGYELANGTYASNCADPKTTINVGQTYNMDVYSSLYPDKLPLFAQSQKWDKINWLYNHLDWYPGYKWYDIQAVVWLYGGWDGKANGTVPATTAIGAKMKADADNYGSGYKVPTGGYACAILVPAGTLPTATTATIQTVFVKVN